MHVPRIPLRREPATEAGADIEQTPSAGGVPQVHAELFAGLRDPGLYEYLRGGSLTESGVTVNVKTALKNPTVFRCVRLVSAAMGMLPMHLLHGGDDFESNKATDHPLYWLLYAEPNNFQSAYDFRSYMQFNALVHGNGYARVVRSTRRVRALIPLDPERTSAFQRPDLSVAYKYRQPDGREITLEPDEVLHLRGLTEDGISGISLVRQAAEAIGLAKAAEAAAARLFRNGMMVGGAITHPQILGPQAQKNLIDSLETRYSSIENAGKWMVLEEGMKAEKFASTAQESEHLGMRQHQVEEIARVFGVPRPFLMVDDTSWGTGIDVLGQFFVRYALNDWFTAWEQAISRTLLVGNEKLEYQAKFNEGALLRGNLKDQADFFSKALGSGGQKPWMTQNNVRRLMNLPPSDEPGADELGSGSMNKGTQANEPSPVRDAETLRAMAPNVTVTPQVDVHTHISPEGASVTKVLAHDEHGRIKEFQKTPVAAMKK